jgi:hypothetical protein
MKWLLLLKSSLLLDTTLCIPNIYIWHKSIPAIATLCFILTLLTPSLHNMFRPHCCDSRYRLVSYIYIYIYLEYIRNRMLHKGIKKKLCIPLRFNRLFRRMFHLHLQCRRMRCAKTSENVASNAYVSMIGLFCLEVSCFSETSVDFQLSIRPYILQDRNVYNHRCETLRSYITNLDFPP